MRVVVEQVLLAGKFEVPFYLNEIEEREFETKIESSYHFQSKCEEYENALKDVKGFKVIIEEEDGIEWFRDGAVRIHRIETECERIDIYELKF